jgi:hypothetical protein
VPEQADISNITGMESDPDLPDTLYHYTDIKGLQGIWEEGNLWGTGSRYLNDTSELQLGVAMLQSGIRHLRPRGATVATVAAVRRGRAAARRRR